MAVVETAKISSTPEARAAIAMAVAAHGPVMFHTSGGLIGSRQFPICLPLAELRIGARDYLLGEVDGIPIYEMQDREGCTRCAGREYILDIADGPAFGFSIAAGLGKRFTLMEKFSCA